MYGILWFAEVKSKNKLKWSKLTVQTIKPLVCPQDLLIQSQ